MYTLTPYIVTNLKKHLVNGRVIHGIYECLSLISCVFYYNEAASLFIEESLRFYSSSNKTKERLN